jgi:hypothetical protein
MKNYNGVTTWPSEHFLFMDAIFVLRQTTVWKKKLFG